MNLPRAVSVWTIVKGAISIVVASGLVLACAAPASTPAPSTKLPSPSPAPSTAAPSPSAASTIAVTSSPPANPAPASAIAFFDREHGLMAGSDATDSVGVIWRTSDGGRSWSSPAIVAPLPLIALDIVGTKDVWALAGGATTQGTCAARTWASTDAGATWHEQGSALISTIAFGDATHGWGVNTECATVAGGTTSGLLATRDGGRTWGAVRDPCVGVIGWAAAVAFTSANQGWVACDDIAGAGQTPKGIMATSDGGRSWALRSRILPGGAPVGSIPLNDGLTGLAMRADGTGMAWGSRGLTIRTTDGGRTWSIMPPGELDTVIAGSGWMFDDREWALLLWDAGRYAQLVETTSDAGRVWSMLAPVPTGEGS